MAEQTLDFWPDIAGARLKHTPLSLIKQQAALLGKHTNNLLEGVVATNTIAGRPSHRFYIKAPTLGYNYELFMVSHDLVELYPVRVDAGPHKTQYRDDQPVLASEPALLDWLKDVLSSDETKRVLGSLLAQIES